MQRQPLAQFKLDFEENLTVDSENSQTSDLFSKEKSFEFSKRSVTQHKSAFLEIDQIFYWFEQKGIRPGNPSNVIDFHREKQRETIKHKINFNSEKQNKPIEKPSTIAQRRKLMKTLSLRI